MRDILGISISPIIYHGRLRTSPRCIRWEGSGCSPGNVLRELGSERCYNYHSESYIYMRAMTTYVTTRRRYACVIRPNIRL